MDCKGNHVLFPKDYLEDDSKSLQRLVAIPGCISEISAKLQVV